MIHHRLLEKGHPATAFSDDKEGMFCHSPDSWIELWDGMVFEKGSVRVVATPVNMKMDKSYERRIGVTDTDVYTLSWCVTRL